MASRVKTDAKRKRAGLALRSSRRRALDPYALDPDAAEVMRRPRGAKAPSSPTIIAMPTVGREGTIGELFTVLLDDTSLRAKALPKSR